MTQDENSGEDRRPADEAEALFERTVRRMLKTPPKPQKDMKLGKARGRRKPEDPAEPGLASDIAPDDAATLDR